MYGLKPSPTRGPAGGAEGHTSSPGTLHFIHKDIIISVVLSERNKRPRVSGLGGSSLPLPQSQRQREQGHNIYV
eukprot:54989-Eustigmatos_ZCMA.PRE.1